MERLNAVRLAASRDRLTACGVTTPGYDRNAVTGSILHVGLGAFARAHVFDYAEELLEAGHMESGVVGGALRTGSTIDALNPQDGLYTRCASDGTDTRWTIQGALTSGERTGGVVTTLADPSTTTVTLTVTEKGYLVDPHTGHLDVTHPDVTHDLSVPNEPVSVPGVLVEGLDRRRRTHGRGVTVISCDNLPRNGAVTATVVHDLAERRDPSLAAWIDTHVCFPSSVVDRIVPATTDDDRARVAEHLGLFDAAPVMTEPHRLWVIERTPDLHPFDRVGALLTDDLAPFQERKLRLVNALHSAAAYLGLARGHATIAEAVSDPTLRGFLERLGRDEIEPTLDPVSDRAAATTVSTLTRFANPTIGHRCAQVAMDGSQKLGPRILDTVVHAGDRGSAREGLATVLAAWIAHLTRSFHTVTPVADPLADVLRTALSTSGSPHPGVTEIRRVLVAIGAPEPLVTDLGFHRVVAALVADPDLGLD